MLFFPYTSRLLHLRWAVAILWFLNEAMTMKQLYEWSWMYLIKHYLMIIHNIKIYHTVTEQVSRIVYYAAEKLAILD